MTRSLAVIALLPLITACAGPELVAIRTDGQRIASSPSLEHVYEADRTVCVGETQKANLGRTPNLYGGFAAVAKDVEQRQASNDVFAGCMAQKGYAMVEKEKADAKIAEYGARAEAIAQEKQNQIMTGSVR